MAIDWAAAKGNMNLEQWGTGRLNRLGRRASLPALVLLLVIAGGAGLRLWGLDRKALFEDEAIHYFAGASIRNGHGPRLPSGMPYERGRFSSWLVGFALDRVSPVERAVRLPSAIFGTVGLAVMGTGMWALLGPWPAVAATSLLALYPEAIDWSRYGRFYALQLVIGLVAMFTGWQLVNFGSPERDSVPENRRLWPTWLSTLLTLACFWAAAQIQIVTLTVFVAWAACILLLGVQDLRRDGLKAFRQNPRVQLLSVGVLAFLMVLTARPELVTGLVEQSQSVPSWANRASAVPGILWYVNALSLHMPLAFACFPLAAFIVCLRSWRLSMYLSIWFVVPLVLHSVFLPFRQERFILLAMPGLFGLVGAIFGWGMVSLYGRVVAAVEQLSGRRGRAVLLARCAVGVVVAGLLTPMLVGAVRTVRSGVSATRAEARWHEAKRILQATPDLALLPLGSGTATPLTAVYYLGRAEFSVRTSLLDREAGSAHLRTTGNPFVQAPVGSSDYYAGVPVVPQPAAVRERFAAADGVIIIVDDRFFGTHEIDPELRRVLREEGRELCHGRCGSLLLFHWAFRAGTKEGSEGHRT